MKHCPRAMGGGLDHDDLISNKEWKKRKKKIKKLRRKGKKSKAKKLEKDLYYWR